GQAVDLELPERAVGLQLVERCPHVRGREAVGHVLRQPLPRGQVPAHHAVHPLELTEQRLAAGGRLDGHGGHPTRSVNPSPAADMIACGRADRITEVSYIW